MITTQLSVQCSTVGSNLYETMGQGPKSKQELTMPFFLSPKVPKPSSSDKERKSPMSEAKVRCDGRYSVVVFLLLNTRTLLLGVQGAFPTYGCTDVHVPLQVIQVAAYLVGHNCPARGYPNSRPFKVPVVSGVRQHRFTYPLVSWRSHSKK
jgi:hypothetical protein